MWVTTILFIISILLFIFALLSIKYNWDIEALFIVYGIIIVICAITFTQKNINNTKEKEAKEILIKGNPYEMVIQYEYKDSIYIAVDTVFYLKEKL